LETHFYKKIAPKPCKKYNTRDTDYCQQNDNSENMADGSDKMCCVFRYYGYSWYQMEIVMSFAAWMVYELHLSLFGEELLKDEKNEYVDFILD